LKGIAGRIRKDLKTILILIIVIVLWRVLCLFFFNASCPSVIFCGFPCPGCGLTRAFVLLAEGRFYESITMNPMAIPVVLFILWCLYWHYVKAEKIRFFTPLLIALCLSAIAVYICRMALYFPTRMPMTFTHGSVLGNAVPGYDTWAPEVAGKILDSISL
jgi:hypothetical protein